MIGHALRRSAPALRASLRHMSTAEAAKPTGLTLNFCLPHKPIYVDKAVDTVIIPGVAGVYGVTQGHSAVISEMQPGLVKIYHEAGGEPENWFVSAGFALTHPNSVTDITAVEAVKVDDMDPEAVKDTFNQAKSDLAAASDEKERVAAQIQMSTAQVMGQALGLNLSA
ncbi:hypothetical protein JKP88DRAFT_184747 [Tribonema minus]|uniref:ATP synthase F1 complex delta/epsilon subunit N-terminal domain-containing protein n=1 Tax=Tribonema minus TaxID=303371 RepID=A0A836CK87_9STRA|nr:hypothetical protein JKP88DRAFT_184747 [Tribonema minus]|eukprot:TRINITY_DN1497_c0_g2_i1.p1 TRINITY_DN1497_c0_g2~~TRINITY_DN1497_c0_g2_i1.p1  ORF type:complete len:168 (+),score=47.12 TRINITY_DN1497_c0_g2_i1:195-698(+)